MSKPMVITGKCWVLRDSDGGRLDNVDTDQIYHNAHLAVTTISEMGQYALGNLEGWEDFPGKVKEGDILVVGHNFGGGSSRQHAVDCFRSLGISAIVGESFGAIYKRNAINAGLPLIEVDGILDSDIVSGDEIKIDLENSTVENHTKGKKYNGVKPFSSVQKDIYLAGSLFELSR
ncbi:MAG TPA: 3-isopropylmalate dehydratase [bacterium]